jgi:hypothetical protein
MEAAGSFETLKVEAKDSSATFVLIYKKCLILSVNL